MTRSSVGVCCCVVAMLLAVGGCGSFDAERSMLQGQIDKAQTQLDLAKANLKEARNDLADSKEQLGQLDSDWRNVVRDLAAANAKEQALGFKLRKAVQRAAAAETKLTEQQQKEQAQKVEAEKAATERQKANERLKVRIKALEADIGKLEKKTEQPQERT